MCKHPLQKINRVGKWSAPHRVFLKSTWMGLPREIQALLALVELAEIARGMFSLCFQFIKVITLTT